MFKSLHFGPNSGGTGVGSPKRDRMRLAFYYQSLLDSGEVETRAELAGHLGVSRARVTQVFRRLDDDRPKSA